MYLFLFQTVIISLTGVMAPGPITAATIGTGARSPLAGLAVAVGHGIVEFPLMVLIYYGLGDILEHGTIRAGVFVLGGLFLLFLGTDLLRSIRGEAAAESAHTGSPLAAGIVLSLGNAYFLVWWATVGASLIARAVTFGLVGVLLFALAHWSCDAIWLTALSVASHRGSRVFGNRFRTGISAMCGIFLVVFGIMFLRDAFLLFHR